MMRKRMITIGCLIAVVGVGVVLNLKMSSETQAEKSDDLSLYKSINSMKEVQEKVGESTDSVGVRQAAIQGPDVHEVLSKDIHKLAQELRVNEDETYRLKELNNFRTPLKDIISRVDPKGYARFLENTVKKLHSCLEVDYCGMQKDSEDSPYFDEQNTIAHKTLLRSLSALEMLIDQGHAKSVKQQVDAGVLERLLENKNPQIQQKAMQLLKKKLNHDQAFNTIIKHERLFNGEAKAYFYEELGQDFSSEEQKEVYLDSLAMTLETNDPHTVLSVVEKIPNLSVDKENVSRLAQGLCRFQTEQGLKHNWPSVNHQIKKLKEQDYIESDFECL